MTTKLSQLKIAQLRSKNKRTLREFSTVWADWVIFGSTKNFCNFANVGDALFFHIFIGKTSKKVAFLHSVASVLNSKIKVGKKENFGFKMYFYRSK